MKIISLSFCLLFALQVQASFFSKILSKFWAPGLSHSGPVPGTSSPVQKDTVTETNKATSPVTSSAVGTEPWTHMDYEPMNVEDIRSGLLLKKQRLDQQRLTDMIPKHHERQDGSNQPPIEGNCKKELTLPLNQPPLTDMTPKYHESQDSSNQPPIEDNRREESEQDLTEKEIDGNRAVWYLPNKEVISPMGASEETTPRATHNIAPPAETLITLPSIPEQVPPTSHLDTQTRPGDVSSFVSSLLNAIYPSSSEPSREQEAQESIPSPANTPEQEKNESHLVILEQPGNKERGKLFGDFDSDVGYTEGRLEELRVAMQTPETSSPRSGTLEIPETPTNEELSPTDLGQRFTMLMDSPPRSLGKKSNVMKRAIFLLKVITFLKGDMPYLLAKLLINNFSFHFDSSLYTSCRTIPRSEVFRFSDHNGFTRSSVVRSTPIEHNVSRALPQADTPALLAPVPTGEGATTNIITSSSHVTVEASHALVGPPMVQKRDISNDNADPLNQPPLSPRPSSPELDPRSPYDESDMSSSTESEFESPLAAFAEIYLYPGY